MPSILSESLAALFPPGAVVAEMRAPGDTTQLLTEEAACLGAGVVPSRAAEFAAGRLCARRALAEFGVHDFPLKVLQDRRPLWPPNWVGSITHTSGMCAAVVAQRSRLLSVGIDCELLGAVNREVWRIIFVAPEVAWLHSLAPAERSCAATMLFSAKEAFYKCQSGLSTGPMNFHDAHIEAEWGAIAGEFLVRPTREWHPALQARRITGRYLMHEGFVSTGVALAPLTQ